jgi:serine/threonine protein kinase
MSPAEPFDPVRRFLGGDDEPDAGPDARLGEIAVSRGYCSEAQVEQALAEQSASSPKILLGQILLRRNALGPEQLLRLLAFQRRPEGGGPAPLPDGVAIGRYALVEVIGRGDRSVVYRGRDASGRTHAVKVLKPAADDPLEAQRLLLAARKAAERGAPGWIRVNEAGLTAPARGPARPYLVMEVVGDPTLEHLLAEGGCSRGALLQILEDAARIVSLVAAAHGVAHGGLKASNVFVDRAGRVRVADFGLARLPHPAEAVEAAFLRRWSGVAPEQLECRVEDPARADVFALGAILYEILCGSPPFEGSGAAELFRAVSACIPVPLRRRTPTVEPDFERLVARTLDRDPARRPADAGAFADELAACRKREPAGR